MRRLLAMTVMLSVFFVGCGRVNNNFDKEHSEVAVMQENTEKQTNVIIDISKIQIVDSNDEVYAEDLFIDASKYASRFKKLYETISTSTEIVMREPLYSIKMIDSKGNVVDIWIVDEYRTIKNSNGDLILRDEDVDSLLTEVENEYSLGYGLLARRPGNQYLSNLAKTDKAKFIKFNQLSFETPIEYILSVRLLDQLKENWNTIKISDKQVLDYSIVYTINYINSDGNEIQTWHIDNNNKVFTSYGYELQGEFIANWVSEVMSEALT